MILVTTENGQMKAEIMKPIKQEGKHTVGYCDYCNEQLEECDNSPSGKYMTITLECPQCGANYNYGYKIDWVDVNTDHEAEGWEAKDIVETEYKEV